MTGAGPTGNWDRAAFDPVEATAVRIEATKADGEFADYLFRGELAVLGDPAKSPSNLVAGGTYTASQKFLDPSYPDTEGKESTDGVLGGHYSDGKSYAYYFTDSGPERTITIDFDLGAARTISMARFRQYFDGEHLLRRIHLRRRTPDLRPLTNPFDQPNLARRRFGCSLAEHREVEV